MFTFGIAYTLLNSNNMNDVKKFKKVNERLTRESSSIISTMEESYKPPKKLIMALLQSV